MLVAFLIGIHIIVPVLLSYEFIRVVPVLEIALISCLTRSLSQPMAFMPLAAGDSKFFLFVDIIDFILMFAVYTTCYAEWGLTGIAYGICTYNLLDLIWVAVCMNIRYGILPNMRNILFFIIQTIILFCAFLTIKNTNGITYWTGGCMLTAISVCISYFLFRTIKHEE
jgi:O-antigen/teichoic acid export membrane protein